MLETTVVTPVRDVPLVDLKRQYAGLRTKTEAACTTVLGSMQLFLGPNVRAFEEEYAHFVGVDYCIGVGDGTAALYLALRACGIRAGDEVITVSHTFFATVEAIALAGATPIFVDIDPTTYTMDVAGVEAAITPRTRAILPVHLYGRMTAMTELMALARRHNLMVIEDACQAHGAHQDGRMAGTVGDVGCFSFYYSKNLGAYGEAGGIVTNDPDIAFRVRMYRDHGSSTRYHHEVLGLNSRLDELQAAVLRIKLPMLNSWNAARRRHATRYNAMLGNFPLVLPTVPGPNHVFHLYVIRTRERDALRAHLERYGVHTGIHYPIPCHRQPACTNPNRQTGSLAVTETVVDEILSLPMFPELSDDEIDYVVAVVADFFNGRDADAPAVSATGRDAVGGGTW